MVLDHRDPPYLLLNSLSAEESCEQTYGFMPCTTTVLGNCFLIIVYGYLMFTAGSELLLEILGPGIIGGLFLPILGALPDAMLILRLPGVLWVLPDSYLDVPNKDYGGDLFIDGKVIHRPQYRYTERQPTRTRPRPRYDRRRETMQVERREPMRESWGQNQTQPVQQPTSMAGQSSTQGGGGNFSTNQGDFNRSNA